LKRFNTSALQAVVQSAIHLLEHVTNGLRKTRWWKQAHSRACTLRIKPSEQSFTLKKWSWAHG